MLTTAATATLTTATHGSDLLTSGATLTAAVHTLTQVAAVAAIVAVCVGGYLLGCLIWPFGKCRRCKGAGKFKSPFGAAFRHCGKCDGSGLRIRTGRKIIGYYRKVRGAGQNTTSSKGGR